MPNPKRRHSKTRGRKRRTHYKASSPAMMVCPSCKEPKLTHQVCQNCGFYSGKSVLIPKKQK